MANIANVKVKSGNVLELSGSSVSISGSQGLNLHVDDGGIAANAGTGVIQLTGSEVGIKGNLVVSGNIEAHRLDIITTETVISSSVLERNGSTRMGNSSDDIHQFSGSILASGSMTIEAGSGQYNGSGAGLTNIPNSALSGSGAITINGASTALGDSITTVGAGDGLAEAAPVSGEIVLSVQLSGSDSGLVVDGGGVKLSGSVARLDRDANFGTNAVTASTFVGNLEGTADQVANAATFTNAAGDAAGITFDGSAARTVGYATLGAATTGSANTFSGLQTFSTALSASAMTGSAALIGTLTLENDLGVAHGGTGLDGSSAANGQLLIGNGSGYTLATLTSGSDKVTITNGAGSISIDIDPDAVAGDFVNKSGVQTDITGAKTFDTITVSGSSGLTLTSDAPLTANGSVAMNGAVTTNVRTVTADASLASDDNVILAQPSADLKITLTAGADGRQLVVKKINEDTNRLYLSGSGCQIDGANEFDMYGPLQSVNLVSSGSNWFVL